MRTMQEKVIASIGKEITAKGFEPVVSRSYSNTGSIGIQEKDEVGNIACVYYNFQDETMTLSIAVNGVKIPSQKGRSDYFDYYMKNEDRVRYNEFKNTLINELKKLKFKK